MRDAGKMAHSGRLTVDASGETARGNDWVLVIDDAARGFAPPGQDRVLF